MRPPRPGRTIVIMRSVVLVLVLIGCGSGAVAPAYDAGPPPEPSIVGDWALTRPDGCAVVYSFRADGAYVGGLACTMSSGAGEIQVDAGDFALAGKTVSFVPHRASCAGVAPYSAGYALTPNLTLTTGSGAVYAFARVPDSTASGTAQFGCFTDAGFVPHAVMDF